VKQGLLDDKTAGGDLYCGCAAVVALRQITLDEYRRTGRDVPLSPISQTVPYIDGVQLMLELALTGSVGHAQLTYQMMILICLGFGLVNRDDDALQINFVHIHTSVDRLSRTSCTNCIDLRGIHAVAYQELLANALAGSAAPDAHMIDESTTEDHATAWRVFGRFWPVFRGGIQRNVGISRVSSTPRRGVF